MPPAYAIAAAALTHAYQSNTVRKMPLLAADAYPTSIDILATTLYIESSSYRYCCAGEFAIETVVPPARGDVNVGSNQCSWALGTFRTATSIRGLTV